MSNTWIRITDPGTRSCKSLSHINNPLFLDTALDKTHYKLKDATGLLLDSTYHMNQIKKGSAHTPQGIVYTFDDYENTIQEYIT